MMNLFKMFQPKSTHKVIKPKIQPHQMDRTNPDCCICKGTGWVGKARGDGGRGIFSCGCRGNRG